MFTKENQQVAETTKEETMFNITPERNKELEKLVHPIFQQYKNSEITNCKLVVDTIALTDNQDEKYYLAYQAGAYAASLKQEDPFEQLMQALRN